MPKESSRCLLIEAKAHLLRMRQEKPLTDAEAAAVDEGIGAMERLCAGLINVPTSFRQALFNSSHAITAEAHSCLMHRNEAS